MTALLLAAITLHSFHQVVELKTAVHHSMKYYLSLPEGWSSKRKWPVVVAIADAERDFEGAARRFAKVRGSRPYIVVVPMVVTNGGSRYREVPSYRYSVDAWNEIDRAGEYTFDLAGIAAVAADVKSSYSGEQRFYGTGFEAGGHTLFAMTFRHPEWMLASVPNSPNFQGRGLSDGAYSTSPARSNLPIHEMHGGDDAFSSPRKPFMTQ